jgi:excisionase family DNA binding protein
MSELLDLKQGAEELHLSIHTLRSWIFQKRLTHVRLGRRCFLRKEDIQDLIKKGVVKAK